MIFFRPQSIGKQRIDNSSRTKDIMVLFYYMFDGLKFKDKAALRGKVINDIILH